MITVTPLAGGLTNRSYLFATPERRFVVRTGSPHSGLPIDRTHEVAILQVAASAGLAPQLVYADSPNNFLVTQYCEGRTWDDTDFASSTQLERLADRLRELHSLPIPDGLKTFDPISTARRYVERIVLDEPSERASLEALLARMPRVLRSARSDERPHSLVHSDLNGSNIVDGAALILVDWEYSGVSDPLQDLACLRAYYPFVEVHVPRLLEGLGLPQSLAGEPLTAVEWIFQLLTWLWYRARRLATRPTVADVTAEERALHWLEKTSSRLPGM